MAGFTGVALYEGNISIQKISTYDWFWHTIALGALFIIVFNLMAITTQRSGLSVVSVATKMSLAIPILFGLLYYKESLGALKLLGIILALIAVYLVSVKTKEGIKFDRSLLVLPVLVFLGSGIIDTSLKFLEDSYVAENDVPIFSATIFGAAATIGLIVNGIRLLKGDFSFELKNIIGGIALGVQNYFSVYFLVKALRSDLWESSGIFTVNNVGVVMTSTLVGILFFSEKLGVKNWLGIVFAIVSIFLIALTGN